MEEKILIVEDEEKLARFVELETCPRGLPRGEGYGTAATLWKWPSAATMA